MKEELKTYSADEFKNKNGEYIFPFEVLDKTIGGSNLGRIEWHIEPVKGKKKKGRYYIEKLLVSASQTRDKRYYGKIFEIPCYTESIYGDCNKNTNSYIHFVWGMRWCEVHNTIYISAYPANNHSQLIINTNSSILLNIDFK